MPLTGEFLAPEDFRKARKSLLIVATTTIVVAGLNITGNGAEVLGLTVDVSQREIVFLEQILTALLCFLYLLKVLPEFVPFIKRFSEFQLKKKQQRATEGLYDDLGYNEIGEHYESPADFMVKDHERTLDSQKSRLERSYFFFTLLLNSLDQAVVSLVLPFGIGFTAVFIPQLPCALMKQLLLVT